MKIVTNKHVFDIGKVKSSRVITEEQIFVRKKKSSSKKRHVNKFMIDSYIENQKKSIKTRQTIAEAVLIKFKTIVENKSKG